MRDGANGFSKAVRTVFVSAAAIALCASLMIAGSYALFTDNVTVHNHLVAGTMNVTLTRKHLEYVTLVNGVATVQEQADDVDFSEATGANVFAVAEKDANGEWTVSSAQNALGSIVPTSYFEATMEIANKSEVAFDYALEIVFGDKENASQLAEQLMLTVDILDASGNVKTDNVIARKVSEDGVKIDCSTLTPATGETFVVRLEFIDDDKTNNAAMAQSVSFDLVVHAVQKTAV